MSADALAIPAVISLAGPIEIREVGLTLELLLQQLARSEPFSVDLAGVSALDTAGAQLLLAVKLEAVRRGVPVSFRGHSKELNSALELLGLHAMQQEPTRGL